MFSVGKSQLRLEDLVGCWLSECLGSAFWSKQIGISRDICSEGIRHKRKLRFPYLLLCRWLQWVSLLLGNNTEGFYSLLLSLSYNHSLSRLFQRVHLSASQYLFLNFFFLNVVLTSPLITHTIGTLNEVMWKSLYLIHVSFPKEGNVHCVE